MRSESAIIIRLSKKHTRAKREGRNPRVRLGRPTMGEPLRDEYEPRVFFPVDDQQSSGRRLRGWINAAKRFGRPPVGSLFHVDLQAAIRRGQSVDQPIDVVRVVVGMRADSQAAGAAA